MKKVLHWVWSFLEVVIIVYVVLITSFILCRNKYGFTQFGDYTFANMTLFDERNVKDAHKGDFLVVKNSNDIKAGDLIYYYAVFNEDYIIKSDVVAEVKADDYTALYTLNDADGTSISSARVLGKYANIYDNVGAFLNIVESRIGFLFFVLLPIMIVFIYQIYEFVIIIRYERVEEEKITKKLDKKKAEKKKQDNDDDIEIL